MEEIKLSVVEQFKALSAKYDELDARLDAICDKVESFEECRTIAKDKSAVRKKLDDLRIDIIKNPEVGLYANFHGYSDVEPFEIVRVVSSKMLEIRPMKCTRDENWKPEVIIGGFSGHTVNNHSQKWIIEPDVDAPLRKIRLTKSGWRDGHSRFTIDFKPIKFYDYNF
jgi:hypothetical protein